jgi:2,5-furandicarboxylate decarboxylase 1
MRDFRQYLSELEELDHVCRVAVPVDPLHELPAVQWQIEKQLFKAVVFEDVKGYAGGTAGNLFLAPLRTGILPTVPFMAEYTTLFAGIRKPGIVYPLWSGNDMFIDMYREIESTVMSALAHPIDPVAAPSEWTLRYSGRDVDLIRQLPAPWYFREDAGPYLTAAVTIARDPESGYLNSGIYRIQVIDERRLAIMVNAKRDLLSILYAAARSGKPLPVAIVTGVAPEMLVAATMSVPFGQSEYGVAGALARSPYVLSQGDTVDLPVPADAEYVIEGYIDAAHRIREGPFTEYDLIASQITESFCINVTAVRTREHPIFHSLVCTSLEMVSLIMPLGMTELAKTRTFLKSISPNVKDLFMLPGVPGTGLAVSLHKQSSSEPLDILRGLFAFSARLKRIVVVDDDIDIYDPFDVQWAVDTRVVAPRDLLVLESTGELTDPARVGDFSVKTGIDATIKKGHAHRLSRSETKWMEEIDLDRYVGGATAESAMPVQRGA